MCTGIADLIVVDPVVLANCVNAVIATQIGATDGEMIHFHIFPELEDEVELGAVNQNKIMEASINGRYDADQTWALRASLCQYLDRKDDNFRPKCSLVGIAVEISLSLDRTFPAA